MVSTSVGPNAFILPDEVADSAIAVLKQSLGVSSLLYRAYEQELTKSGHGQTITITVPAVLTAKQRTLRTGTPLQVDNLEESTRTLKIDQDIYEAVSVEDEELTFDINNYTEQVLIPQMEAVAVGLDDYSVSTMLNANYHTQNMINLDDSAPVKTLNRASTILTKRFVPRSRRRVIMSPDIAEKYKNLPQLQNLDTSGTTQVLREALLGRLMGFDLYEFTNLPDDTMIAFHETAFLLATRPPKMPNGVANGKFISHEGINMRWINDYDATNVTGRSFFSTYAGADAYADGPVVSSADTLVRAVLITDN